MKRSRLLGVACALVSVISFNVSAASVSGQGTWETTLKARDFDGDASTIEGWYDTVLNITWLADANANGMMTSISANAWATGLNYGAGIDSWRLPTMVDTSSPGCDYSVTGGTDCGFNVLTTSGSPPYPTVTVYSEMASMFYGTLGNKSYFDTSGGSPQSGWGLTNTGPFDNIEIGSGASESDYYWSGLIYSVTPLYAWVFDFEYGAQNAIEQSAESFAWAVHDGDVGAVVPVPATVWLFGSGLLGLVGMARRKRAT